MFLPLPRQILVPRRPSTERRLIMLYLIAGVFFVLVILIGNELRNIHTTLQECLSVLKHRVGRILKVVRVLRFPAW